MSPPLTNSNWSDCLPDSAITQESNPSHLNQNSPDEDVMKDATHASQDDDDADDVTVETNSALTLLSLPPEILLNIISFLDARFVIQRLSLVSKEFHELIANDATWKIRISKRWPEQYPVIPVNDDDFDWQLACMEREDEWRAWTKSTMDYFSLSNGHFGEIDAVHLMKDGELCISGSRDRTFHLWDLRKLDVNNPEESIEQSKITSVDGHKGWVWDISSKDNIICTSSWDSWIKLWDINVNCGEVQRFKGKSAMLCSSIHQHVIHTGAYKHIYVFDRRDGTNSSTLDYHTRPVLCITSNDDYIISGSEDETVAVFDRRAGRLFKRVQLDQFPLCMSYGLGQLWVGRKDGQVNVIDPTQGRFDIVQTYDVGHKGKITGILHSLGSVMTCSTEPTIRIHTPTHNPTTFCTIPRKGATASIHRDNNVYAAGGSDLCVGIWRPNNHLEYVSL